MYSDTSDTLNQQYLKGLTLLYVEDEDDVRVQFGQFLSRFVGTLVTAVNGAEGIEAYREHNPDIILTDIQMPVMDGLSMASKIREMNKSVPIIVITAYDNNDYLKSAINIGIDKYVTKPVNGTQFFEALLEQAQNLRTDAEIKQAQALQQDKLKLLVDIVDETSAGTGNDIESMLSHLFAALAKIPSVHIQNKGVVRMYNSWGKAVTVARFGIKPVWLEPLTNSIFANVSQEPCSEAFIAPMTTAERALVLPLASGSTSLGQIIIVLSHGWSPSADSINFMTRLAQRLSRLVNRCLTHEILQIREIEIEEARTEALKRLEAASEYRDNETGMHIMRMTNFAVAIAKTLGVPEHQRNLLYLTAPMHDVGKIGIPDAILLKPGKLTEEEFEVMKSHTEIGERLLHGKNPMFDTARAIAMSHHENWDGSGYPRGLQGEGIPLLARICAIADVFDALTSRRPYKDAWTTKEAVAWIKGESGSKFEPALVEALESSLPEILRIRELFCDEVINPNQILNLPEPACDDARWVKWDSSLSIGIDVIDEHHRYLFHQVNDLINVIVNKLGARELMRVLKTLMHYVQVHFQAEERMMEHYGYGGTFFQKRQHRQFQDKLDELFKELHNNPLVVKNETAAYMYEWLVAHIRHEDTRLRVLAGGV